jgi:SAM-dependent methyltransferase
VAIDVARARVGDDIRWHVSPLHTFDPGRTFDLVICIDVLFHIVDDELWRRTLLNLASIARPTGVLLIQEHLVEERQVRPASPDRSRHVRWRSELWYRQALSEWDLVAGRRYALPREEGTKDLMLFRRKDR